ncbi:MAG: PAS domain-containing protein [Candidatus Sulfotelmatobacter sp.]
MLYANYDFTLVAVLVAVVFSAVALITIRHARKAHGSLSAAFRNLVQTMHSVPRDDGEIRFRTLAEALPQIVWTAIPGNGVDCCNCRWYQLTGFTEAQTLGWGWPNALHPDDRPVALENWEKCRHTGESIEMEYRLLNAAGGFRWHLVRATPMRDSDGVIVKWFGACADIDDQIRNQQLSEEQIRQHTAALMEANTLLQSEMCERALAQPELNLQNERMVRELTKRSNRATNLAKMAELLQSCSEVTDAFSVVAGMAPKVFPELRGALHLFNSSPERLEVAAIWEDCTLPDNAFGPQDCWALRTGHMHVVLSGDHSARMRTRRSRRSLLRLPAVAGARRSDRHLALPDDRAGRSTAARFVDGRHVHRAGRPIGGQHSPARSSS